MTALTIPVLILFVSIPVPKGKRNAENTDSGSRRATPAVQTIHTAAVTGAAYTVKSIKTAADFLASLMADAHRADFRAVVDHEHEFILIRSYEPKSRPKPKEAI